MSTAVAIALAIRMSVPHRVAYSLWEPSANGRQGSRILHLTQADAREVLRCADVRRVERARGLRRIYLKPRGMLAVYTKREEDAL